MAFNMMILIVIAVAIIGVTLIVLLSGKYPIKVIIFEKRANGFIIKNGKAGRLKNKASGVWEYRMKLPKGFMSETKVTKPQKYENIYTDEKGKSYLFVYSDGKDQYVPCGIETFKGMLEARIKVLDEDLCQFQVHSYRDSDQRYKGTMDIWAKYGNVITLAVLAICIMLIFYSSQYLYAGVAEQNAQSANILSQLTQNLAKTGQVATGG
jgi:hypothetical protein